MPEHNCMSQEDHYWILFSSAGLGRGRAADTQAGTEGDEVRRGVG